MELGSGGESQKVWVVVQPSPGGLSEGSEEDTAECLIFQRVLCGCGLSWEGENSEPPGNTTVGPPACWAHAQASFSHISSTARLAANVG